MAYHQHRQMKSKPLASPQNENNKPFHLTPPPCKVFNRYTPERWEEWELSYLRAFFRINPNPDINLRKNWAMQLTEGQVLEQKRRLRNGDINICTTRHAFDITKAQWHEQYERRVTNWFKNTRAKINRDRAPLAGDLPNIAADDLSYESPSTSYSTLFSSFIVDYDEDDGNTPIPEMSHRRPDYDATAQSVAAMRVQPETTNLDNLATVAAEALERRIHNPYPEYPESVIYGAHLLLNLKRRGV